MTTTTPQVSILIPVFNRRTLIRETVQSALNQTFTDIEVVICDNASTDGTWSVCEELAALDSRVRIFRNPENLGPVRNWMRCIEEGRGIYGKILFSDDLIQRRFVERTLPLMRPDVGFVFAMTEIGPKSGQGWPALRWRPADGLYKSREFIKDVLYDGEIPVSPTAAIFRLRDLRNNLIISPLGSKINYSKHGAGTDMLFFLLMAQAYPNVGFVAEELVFFRSHEGSITAHPDTRNVVSISYNATRIWFASRYASSWDAYRMLARAWLILMGIRRRWIFPGSLAEEVGWRQFSATKPLFWIVVAWEFLRNHYWKVFRKPRE